MMKRTTFKQRRRQHDELAMPIVEGLFVKLGFDKFDDGVETDNKEKRIALSQQRDMTSLMYRYRPDTIMVKRGKMSLLCEVKSESEGHKNFAIEVDSYTVSHNLQLSGQKVMYAFVDLSDRDNRVLSCWSQDIPQPTYILMPMRFDYQENLERLREQYPLATFRSIRMTGGSGTPFFLLPKASSILLPFAKFAQQELGFINGL